MNHGSELLSMRLVAYWELDKKIDLRILRPKKTRYKSVPGNFIPQEVSMPARRFAIILSILSLLLVSRLYLLNSSTTAQASTFPLDVQYKEDINGYGKVLINDIVASLIMGRGVMPGIRLAQ